jgi:hypothetical protein
MSTGKKKEIAAPVQGAAPTIPSMRTLLMEKFKREQMAAVTLSVPNTASLKKKQQGWTGADPTSLEKSNIAVLTLPFSCDVKQPQKEIPTDAKGEFLPLVAGALLEFHPLEKDAGTYKNLLDGKLVAVAEAVIADEIVSSETQGVEFELPFKSALQTSSNIKHKIPTSRMATILSNGLDEPCKLMENVIDANVLGFMTTYGGALLKTGSNAVFHKANGQTYLLATDPMNAFFDKNSDDFSFEQTGDLHEVFVSFADEDFETLKTQYDARGNVNVDFFDPATFAITVRPTASKTLSKAATKTLPARFIQRPNISDYHFGMSGTIRVRLFEKVAPTTAADAKD